MSDKTKMNEAEAAEVMAAARTTPGSLAAPDVTIADVLDAARHYRERAERAELLHKEAENLLHTAVSTEASAYAQHFHSVQDHLDAEVVRRKEALARAAKAEQERDTARQEAAELRAEVERLQGLYNSEQGDNSVLETQLSASHQEAAALTARLEKVETEARLLGQAAGLTGDFLSAQQTMYMVRTATVPGFQKEAAGLRKDRERLRRVLAAEQGREGLEGWEWDWSEWKHPLHGTVRSQAAIEADGSIHTAWYRLDADGYTVKACYSTALEAMEAATNAAKETGND